MQKVISLFILIHQYIIASPGAEAYLSGRTSGPVATVVGIIVIILALVLSNSKREK